MEIVANLAQASSGCNTASTSNEGRRERHSSTDGASHNLAPAASTDGDENCDENCASLMNTPKQTAGGPQLRAAHVDQLPDELLHEILEYLLARDFYCNAPFGVLTLKYMPSCTRVSRRWRAVALPLLYREQMLFLDPQGRFKSPQYSPTQLPAMQAFFTRFERLALHIHKLQLMHVIQDISHSYHPHDLFAALRVLRNLRYLNLYGISVSEDWPDAPAHADRLTLQTLAVTHVSRPRSRSVDMDNYTGLFRMFRSVDHLELQAHVEGPPAAGWARESHLQDVKMDVRVARISSMDSRLQSIYSDMLSRSTTLRHIEIVHYSYSDPGEFPAVYKPPNSTEGSRLLSLFMHVGGPYNDVWMQDVVSYVTYFLPKADRTRPLAILVVGSGADTRRSASRMKQDCQPLVAYLHNLPSGALPALTLCYTGWDRREGKTTVRCAELRAARDHALPRWDEHILGDLKCGRWSSILTSAAYLLKELDVEVQ